MRLVEDSRRLRFWEMTALVALFLEVVGLVVYATALNSVMTLAILFLLALAATGGGGMLGFLFGIPRYRTDAHVKSNFLYNTNLEQVSDWLTKIIIGATLVEIDEIAGAIGRVSAFVGTEIGGDGHATVACSIIVFSFVGGFMWAYLWMSLRVKPEYEGDDTAPDAGKQAKSRKGAAAPAAVRPVG